MMESACALRRSRLLLLLTWFMLVSSWVCEQVTASVSYDSKGLVIDGKTRLLISGSIHYPRSTPEMWPALIQKAKDGGLDVIETYVFWNIHEPVQGQLDFKGRFDLVHFIKLVQKAGLYVHLRIGPYISAEWNFGGFPVWLKFVERIAFRTDNDPFKMAMQNFTELIVRMMKNNQLYQPQGGPIILSQIENEYELNEARLGEHGKSYVKWAANMAVKLKTGVPWVMCKQADAPGPVINTCNGVYCHDFVPNNPSKPKMWTELWVGWFSKFDGPVPHRPVEDIAFAVARFIQNNGSFFNYYMYHGGTNFNRSAASFVTTSYDYSAPIDEYGLARQPAWGHLRNLHKVIKQCETAIVSVHPQVLNLGNNQEAHVYNATATSDRCVAFLANYDERASVTVKFKENSYFLPPWSVSILPDCKKVAFNTANVTVERAQARMEPVNEGSLSWKSYAEEVASSLDRNAIPMKGFLEQVSVTMDRSDYMWYLSTVNIQGRSGQDGTLTVNSAGHGLLVFINGNLAGTVYGSRIIEMSVHLNAGSNTISLLSVAVGLQYIGLKFETWPIGVTAVKLVLLDGRTQELQKWAYKAGLKGEALRIYARSGSFWTRNITQEQPLKWHMTEFRTPQGNDPIAVDMSTMKKGQIWVNNNNIGRYWFSGGATSDCNVTCRYSGRYYLKKCSTNCNELTRYYHVPREWLKTKGSNRMVVFEEMGGDLSGIRFVKRKAG